MPRRSAARSLRRHRSGLAGRTSSVCNVTPDAPHASFQTGRSKVETFYIVPFVYFRSDNNQLSPWISLSGLSAAALGHLCSRTQCEVSQYFEAERVSRACGPLVIISDFFRNQCHTPPTVSPEVASPWLHGPKSSFHMGSLCCLC